MHGLKKTADLEILRDLKDTSKDIFFYRSLTFISFKPNTNEKISPLNTIQSLLIFIFLKIVNQRTFEVLKAL